MLTLRRTVRNDYTVHEDGQPIGRIRSTRERSPGLWLGTVTVNIPGPPYGDAKTMDEAKQRFKAAGSRSGISETLESWRRCSRR